MWQVYKDYDGYAPDTPPVVVTEDKEIAIEVANFLNGLKDDDNKDGCFAYSEGHEWCAAWRVREYRSATVVKTLEEAKEHLLWDMQDVIRDNLEDEEKDASEEAVKAAFEEMWS